MIDRVTKLFSAKVLAQVTFEDTKGGLKSRRSRGQRYGVKCHFQQYFNKIMAVILLVEETEVPGENHRSAASH